MAEIKPIIGIPNCTKDEISYEIYELVLCKDCKYWTSEKILEYHICKRWESVGVKNFATDENWFCADGEHRLFPGYCPDCGRKLIEDK